MLNSTFYDHWMAQNLTKWHNSAFSFMFTAPHAVLTNCRPTSGRRTTNLAPFDSSQWDDSNELWFGLPWPLDGSQFGEITTYCFVELCGIQWTWKAEFTTIRIVSMRRIQWVIIWPHMTTGCPQFNKTACGAVNKNENAESLTFRRIVGHSVVVESRI